ncbi:ceramidase [Gorgonomyces haynaldii]|nr:ceramidase [Gorgonomyces haynaldii]
MLIYAVFVTVVYVRVRNPVFHEVCYALCVVPFFILPVMHMMELKDPRQSKRLTRLFLLNITSYLTGFLLWNIENRNCVYFRELRKTLPYPVSEFFQLHGWWHMLTGFGAYGMIVHQQYMHSILNGNHDFDFVYRFGLPLIVQKKRE